MRTSYETITGNENFDFNKLKEVAKELNESGLLSKKINMIGCKKEEAVKRFLDAVEKLPDEDIQKMPDTVYELNNSFIDILNENDREDESKSEEKIEEKKEKSKKEKKKEEIKKEVEIDEFGYEIGSKRNLFIKAIKDIPMTMAEVRKLPWNSTGSTFYGPWKMLIEKGIAMKTKDNKLTVKDLS